MNTPLNFSFLAMIKPFYDFDPTLKEGLADSPSEAESKCCMDKC
jgi:hypothetical protein